MILLSRWAWYGPGVPKSGQPWDPDFATRSPLFAPFARLTAAFHGRGCWPGPEDFDALVRAEQSARAAELPALRFAPTRPRPRRARRGEVQLEALYDGSIARRGQVPCVADSYHDLWNAIVFAAFPRSKHALHARQFRALCSWATPGAPGLPSRRTREQDALTVFDEGGSVLVGDTSFFERWRAGSAAIDVSRGASASVIVFGHALLELAGYGRAQIRSCAVFLVRDDAYRDEGALDWVDRRLAARIADPERFTRPGADGVVCLDRSGRLWVEPPESADVAPT